LSSGSGWSAARGRLFRGLRRIQRRLRARGRDRGEEEAVGLTAGSQAPLYEQHRA